jgi:hypothetical protein
MPAPLIAPEWGERQWEDDWGRDSSRSRGRSRGSDADWDMDRDAEGGRRSRGSETATASVCVKVRMHDVLLLTVGKAKGRSMLKLCRKVEARLVDGRRCCSAVCIKHLVVRPCVDVCDWLRCLLLKAGCCSDRSNTGY